MLSNPFTSAIAIPKLATPIINDAALIPIPSKAKCVLVNSDHHHLLY